MRVLILDDDVDVLRSTSSALRAAGYVVDEATSWADAELKLDINDYDVAVLDRTVPGGDGLDLVVGLRSTKRPLPVLMLTALADVADRVDGLRAGADDYLVKPFALDEMVARVHALSRRAGQSSASPILELDDIVVDPSRREASRGGTSLPLTSKEFVLLRFFASRVGQLVTRTDLIEHCWDELSDPMSNVVDVKLGHLRAKLGEPPVIHTVRGVGFIAESRRT
jgi:DNA-binding response OmpR family regulator